ncbi:Uncharacterized protein TCM_002956 [Theobroma cacao]|uniref:Uncharacterized protein n=1 Tax=Theobroma cacao TaxID=3641 RepID=A0A061DM94_THECC|nr:Uncharacterized protein TCM_002956 [Theobroma cacao]
MGKFKIWKRELHEWDDHCAKIGADTKKWMEKSLVKRQASHVKPNHVTLMSDVIVYSLEATSLSQWNP